MLFYSVTYTRGLKRPPASDAPSGPLTQTHKIISAADVHCGFRTLVFQLKKNERNCHFFFSFKNKSDCYFMEPQFMNRYIKTNNKGTYVYLYVREKMNKTIFPFG